MWCQFHAFLDFFGLVLDSSPAYESESQLRLESSSPSLESGRTIENKDAHLMTKVNSLAQDMSDKNSALEKKNGELATKLKKVETSQDQLKTKDDQLTAKVEDLNTKNTAMTKKNGDFASKIASLEAKDTHLMLKISSLCNCIYCTW